MQSKLWFVVAGVIAAATLGVVPYYEVSNAPALDDLMTRLVVPGSVAFDLDGPGRYTIFRDADGQWHGLKLPEELQVRLVDEANGTPVDLVSASGNVSYTMPGHVGASIFTFIVDHPGRYRLTADSRDGRTSPMAVLAVDRGMMTGLVHAIGHSFLIMAAGLAVAATIAGITFWQRTRKKA
jgi:hypothetical protein